MPVRNDNLRWFTPELLDRISRITVREGRACLGISIDAALHGRCDSFVVETDVHFPTDINLLWDAARKTLQLTHRLCELTETAGWRQAPHLLKKVKRQYRTVQKISDKEKKETIQGVTGIIATQTYIDTCAELFKRSSAMVTPLRKHVLYDGLAGEILYFIEQGNKQIDQICRRYFKDETIPHHEKVFSLFEPHTEWIVKGKAGISQELGLRVCIVESSDRFILLHMVMENHYGLEGFRRYVALAIVARNIHRLGCIIQKQELEKENDSRGVRKKAA